MELDKFDRLIVESLHHNARQSGAELARRVNLSAPAVAERLHKLERAGVIRGYQAVLNPEALGSPIQCLIELTLARADYLHAPGGFVSDSQAARRGRLIHTTASTITAIASHSAEPMRSPANATPSPTATTGFT